MVIRVSGWSPWITSVGTAAILIGLSLDALLHGLDPSLAAREGVFALGNPGHIVAGLGIIFSVVGAVLFLADRVRSPRGYSPLRRTAFGGYALSLVLLATASFSMAATTNHPLEGHTAQAHDHGAASDATVSAMQEHDHGAPPVVSASAGQSEWTSLRVLATPDSPEVLDGTEGDGGPVATRRLGSGSILIPAGSALKLVGRMSVDGTQGGVIISNTAPSGSAQIRRIYVQSVNRGEEWRVGYRGEGSEATEPRLSIPGGDHGGFELVLEADGRHGTLTFSDGSGGPFDLGEDLYAGFGQRLIVNLIYGTLRTRVEITELELLASAPNVPAGAGAQPGGAGAHGHESTNASMGETGQTGHGHGPRVAVSADQLVAAARLVSEVQASAARFEDINVAREEGYQQSTPGLSGFPHFHNRSYASDGRILDPERPESLVYYRGPGGQMKFVGVMFLMPDGQSGPQVGGPLTVWHTHDNLCYDTQSPRVAARATADGQCPPGSVLRAQTVEMLHVWVVDHPGGVFADEMEPTSMIPFLTSSAP
jgi:hypothetical protein